MRTFVGKMMSLLFNSLSRFAIVFLPRSKCLLISWLPSLSTVILEPKKTKSSIVSAFSSSICHEVVGLDVMILVLWMLSFKPAFSLSSFTLNSPFCSLVSLHLCWSYFVARGNKICHCFHFSPSICHEVMGLDAMIFVFWMLSFKLAFSLSSFTFIKRFFGSSLLSAIRVVSPAYLRLLIFLSWHSWFLLVIHPARHFL